MAGVLLTRSTHPAHWGDLPPPTPAAHLPALRFAPLAGQGGAEPVLPPCGLSRSLDRVRAGLGRPRIHWRGRVRINRDTRPVPAHRARPRHGPRRAGQPGGVDAQPAQGEGPGAQVSPGRQSALVGARAPCGRRVRRWCRGGRLAR